MNDSTPTAAKSKRPLSVDLLFIGVISLLAVGSWVIFDVYRAFTKTTVPRVLQRQVRALDSTIDPELFGSIRSRRQFTDEQLGSVVPKPYIPLEERTVTITPSPTPTIPQSPLALPTPASPSALPTSEITPSPVATQSGGINL